MATKRRTPAPRPAASRKAAEPASHRQQDALTALAERVTALEQSVRRKAAGPDAASAPGGTNLFVIDGLRAQLSPEQGGVAYGGHFLVPGGGELQWQMGRTQDDLLAEDWSELAPRLAALAHPVRLHLLKSLLAGEGSVQQLQALPQLGTTGQLYHHLRELEAGGWIVSVQRGRYQVAPARVIALLAVLAATRQ
jgi:hypothetical protein